MSRHYKDPSKRIHFRGTGGRFRKGRLSDLGMGYCETHERFTFVEPKYHKGHIDPTSMVPRCPECTEERARA